MQEWRLVAGHWMDNRATHGDGKHRGRSLFGGVRGTPKSVLEKVSFRWLLDSQGSHPTRTTRTGSESLELRRATQAGQTDGGQHSASSLGSDRETDRQETVEHESRAPGTKPRGRANVMERRENRSGQRSEITSR